MQKKSRHIVTLFLVLLLASIPVSATITSLSLGKNNDWYTMGLGHNHDDGLSFGSTVEAEFSSSLVLRLQSGGYTDRLVSMMRYDVTSLSASYPFSYPAGKTEFTFTPSVAVVSSGNLGFEKAQNFLHGLIDRDPLTLPYTTEEATFHPALGARIALSYGLPGLTFAFDLNYEYAHQWEQVFNGNLSLRFGTYLSLQVGYLFRNTSDICPVHQLMVDRYQGATLSYQWDGGLLQTQFISYLQTGRSFGGFSLDILSLGKPKQFRYADFIFSTGFLYDLNGQQNRLFSFTYKKYSLEIRHKNGPMFNHMEDQNDRLNVGSYMVGYAWSTPLFPNVEPYAKLLAGVQRFNLQKDFTTTVIESLHPTVAVEIGMKGLGIPGWVIERQNYRLRFTSTLQYVFNVGTIAEIDPYFSEHTGPWILMTGIVIDVEHDREE